MKLIYADARGAVEGIRYMLALADAEYEDFRFPIDLSNGFPPIRKEFDAAQAAGELWPNMGRVPVFNVNGVEAGQSKAIARYVARKFGFMGEGEIDALLVDATVDHVADIVAAYQKPRALPDGDEKTAAMSKWFDEELPTWMGKLEKVIVKQSKAEGFAVGNKITWADIQVYNLVEEFFDNKEAVKKACASCPNLKAVAAQVSNNDKIKAWQAKRPQTAF